MNVKIQTCYYSIKVHKTFIDITEWIHLRKRGRNEEEKQEGQVKMTERTKN